MRATPITPQRQKASSTSIESNTSRSVPERRSASHSATPASTYGSLASRRADVTTPIVVPPYATPARKVRHSAPPMPTIKEHSHTGSPTKLSASITENNDNIESWRSKCRWSHLNPEQSQQIIDYCEDNAARESVGFVANASDDVFSRTNERVAPMSGDELYFRPEPEQASAGVTISPEATLNINMRTDRTPVAITSNNAQTFYPPEAAIFCGNLPKNLHDARIEEDLELTLREHGMCWVKVKRDHNELPVGFAQFETANHARAALKTSVRIGGRKIRFEKAKAPRTLLFYAIDGHTMEDSEFHRILGICGPLAAIDTPTTGDIAAYKFPHFAKLVTFAFYQDAIDAQAEFRGHFQYRLQAVHPQFKAGEVGPWGQPRLLPVGSFRRLYHGGLGILGAVMRCVPQTSRRRRARFDVREWTVAEGWSSSGSNEWTQLNVRKGEAGRRNHQEQKDEWLYVANIPNGTDVRELFEHFSVEGQIIGIAFVTRLEPELILQAVQNGLSATYAILRFSIPGSVQASVDSSNGAHTNAGTALRVQPLQNTFYWVPHTNAYNVRTIPNSIFEQVPVRPHTFYPQIWQNHAFNAANFGPSGPPPMDPLPPLPPGARR